MGGPFGAFREVEALADSGFNGYLTLPFPIAFPLGLSLIGIQTARLADSSITHHFVCLGKVKCHDKEVLTPIDIQPNCEVLMGIKLLRLLKKKLLVDPITATAELLEVEGSVLLLQGKS